MNEKIKKWSLVLKNKKAILALGIIGVLLIFLSGLLPTDTQEAKSVTEFDVEAYKQILEKDVTKLSKDISGCRVLRW